LDSATKARLKIVKGMTAKGLTQKQAADQIGISQAMLNKLINPNGRSKNKGKSFLVEILDKVIMWRPRVAK